MTRTLWKLSAAAFFSAGAASLLSMQAAQASPVEITSLSALGSSPDSYDWGQLGLNNFISLPATVTSAGGNTASVSDASGSAIVAQQPTTWIGNFPDGTNVLYNFYGGPDTLVFANPVQGFFGQIQAGVLGSFTAQIDAYNSSNVLLGSYSASGVSDAPGNGTPVSLGMLDNTPDIAKIVYSTTYSQFGDVNDFGLGPIYASNNVSPPAETPLPASWTLFAGGLAGLALLERRRRQQQKALSLFA